MNSEHYYEFHRSDRDALEYAGVARIARSIYEYTQLKQVSEKIEFANQPNKHSDDVKSCIGDHAEKLGFQGNKPGLFSDYGTKNVCPDFYLSLSDGRGIICEVEKSRTIENNNDILDLWKCHICRDAQYLFLMVPRFYRSGQVYTKVLKRLEPFFREGNYVNIYGLFVMGY